MKIFFDGPLNPKMLSMIPKNFAVVNSKEEADLILDTSNTEKSFKNLLNVTSFLYELIGKFVEPEVLESILKEKSLPEPCIKEIGVAFIDIRGFTRYANKTSPQKVFQILQDFASESEETILFYGGQIDKYIGDCAMAIWTNPENYQDPTGVFIKAIITLFHKIKNKFEAENLSCGAGLNIGKALIGFAGSNTMLDFTAIGHTVNIAARLESVARSWEIAFPYKLLRDSQFLKTLPVQHEVVDVKGSPEPIEIGIVNAEYIKLQ